MSVTRLCFQLGPGTNQIDLARALSLHNRTSKIHQKQIFTVLGGMVVDNPSTSQSIELSTAPNTWVHRAAVNRCFKAWKKYRHELLLDSGLQPSKYADFRLRLNTSGTHLKPINLARQPLAQEEWQYSEVTNESGGSISFRIVGSHGATTYSAIKGWLLTTGMPFPASEPAMPDLDGVVGPDYKVDFLSKLFGDNAAIEDRLDDVVEENDERPFDLEQIYGNDIDEQNNLQSQSYHYVSDNNPHAMIPGFKALCGLIQVDCGSEVTGPLLYLDVLNTPEAF